MLEKLAEDIAFKSLEKLALHAIPKDIWQATRAAISDARARGIAIKRSRPDAPVWMSATGGQPASSGAFKPPVIHKNLPVGQSEYHPRQNLITVGKGIPRDSSLQEVKAKFNTDPRMSPEEAQNIIRTHGVNRSPIASFMHEWGHSKPGGVVSGRRDFTRPSDTRELTHHMDEMIQEQFANTNAYHMFKTPEARQWFEQARGPSYNSHLRGYNNPAPKIDAKYAPQINKEIAQLYRTPIAKTPEEVSELKSFLDHRYSD